MFRFFFLLGLLLTLSIQTVVKASDVVDSFAMATSDLPPPVSPVMRSFLQDVALKLKKDWQNKSQSESPKVLASFAGSPDKTWHIKPVNSSDKTAVLAAELLEKELHGITTPGKQQVNVLFVFDKWPRESEGANKKLGSSGNEDVDFGPFLVLLTQKVRANWNLIDKPKVDTKSIVEFTVKKDGSVKDVHLTNRSKFKEYDKAALNAINNSAPFLSLPMGSVDSIRIQYTFQNQTHSNSKTNSGNRFTVFLSQPDVVLVRP